MQIPFLKTHGAGNDFLLTLLADAPRDHLPFIARAICDRHTGVGADGWMIVDPAPGDGYDASIRLFNSDGSEPELSGNGTRCAAALLVKRRGKHEFRILTGAGVKHVRLLRVTGKIFEFEMNMGNVRVLDLHAPIEGRDAVLIDAGNPQCAIPFEQPDFDWRALGMAIEGNPRFPNRTNVSFLRLAGHNTIEVRFWERGAGATRSSGTGSAGAVAAAIARGMAESPVTVLTEAGPLTVRSENSELLLTGPAELVADGIYYATNPEAEG